MVQKAELNHEEGEDIFYYFIMLFVVEYTF